MSKTRTVSKTLLSISLSLVVLATHPSFVASKAHYDKAPRDPIVEYLNTSEELRKSFTCRFTGEFRAIPEELTTELRAAFPEYKFYIARMEVYLDPPAKKYEVVLVTDAVQAKVVGFVWGSYWTIPPSVSFEEILKGHQPKTKEDAIYKVKSLAKLVAYSSGSEVGSVTMQKGKIRAELRAGEVLFRILEVRINSRLKFGRLAITGPDGRRVRYFV